jgi:hypothetical protein
MPSHWGPATGKGAKEVPLTSIRQIHALEVLRYISRGTTKEGMMRKFGLSAPAFESILNQLSIERRRRAENILADFKSGMTPHEIAERNHFRAENFQKILNDVERVAFYYPRELGVDSGRHQAQLEFEERRRLFRVHSPVLVTKIYAVTDPELPGLILDLSEGGLRTQGLQGHLEEKKSFFFAIGDCRETEPIRFDCRCRWTTSRDAPRGVPVAGFEITSISKSNLGILKTVVAMERALEVAS